MIHPMKRLIITDGQSAQSVLDAAAAALDALGVQYVLLAEDATSSLRRSSKSLCWIRGAMEHALDVVFEALHDQEHPVAPEDEAYGQAEP